MGINTVDLQKVYSWDVPLCRKKARARRADALGLVAGGAARNVSENLLFKPFSTSGRNLLGAFEVHANAPRALGKRAIGISF